MKAVVLAGGYATRLRPISYTLPKHLFPVLGKPVIERTLDVLQANGVTEVILAVNYMAEQLRSYLGTRYGKVRVTYSLEDEPLGTGGPIRLAAGRLRGEGTFVAMNGDVLADFDIAGIKSLHAEQSAQATLALKQVDDPSRFGVAVLDRSGRILRFVEKPPRKDAPSRLINAGLYVMSESILKKIPSGRKVIIEREVFPKLAKAGRLYARRHQGYWFDIGNLRDFINANFYFLRTTSRRRTFIGRGARIHKTAKIKPNTIIGQESAVGPRAIIKKSILFDNATVGGGSTVMGAVVANNVTIGRRVRISPGCIISSNCQISDGVRLVRNVIVHPHREITKSVTTPGHVL